MRVLFIGYWAFHEGLTASTIFPHLKILSEMEEIEKVVFVSIERDLSVNDFEIDIKKIEHVPLYSSGSTNVFLNKLYDFTVFPKKLASLCSEHSISKVICRGAPAGALGYLLHKKTQLPFLVESFEPHADYMRESGVWSKYDPRFLLQKYWEGKQKKYAQHLIPVAHNYRKKLISEGVEDSRIKVIPCTVDFDQFKIDPDQRSKTRDQLKLDNKDVLGVYVGKFGGLYLEKEAFQIFKQFSNHFGQKFKLIILSPTKKEEVLALAHSVGFKQNFELLKVKHTEIPSYLNAADMAFTFYKQGESKKYLSPIKIGEYLACGLPVLISDGIGDDSEIIKNKEIGFVFESSMSMDFTKIESLIKKDKNEIRSIAKEYRNPAIDKLVYHQVLKSE